MLEAQGLATLTIGTVPEHIQNTKPPRGLICHFPLGRPLGVPNDAAFQHRVLATLFEQLKADRGPVLDTFDTVLDAVADEQLVCSLPPRMDPDEHPAVDEARALKSAYDRAVSKHGNRVGVCREVEAADIPDAVEAFARVAQGAPIDAAGIPGVPMRVAQDIRGYYQTAALELAEHSPGAWAGENWFYEQTETGKLMLNARRVLKDAGAPHPVWFYLSPGDRQ